MITYVIESQGYFKIGRTRDLKSRLLQYTTHNPVYELVHTITGDFEMYLHRKYKSKQLKNEWYSLSEEDINEIRTSEYKEGDETPKKIHITIDASFDFGIVKD